MTDTLHSSVVADLSFFKAVLDALDTNIALLDEQGTILAVNASWQRFGEANGIRDKLFGVGVNYFAFCRAAVDPDARAAAKGIKDVLRGRRSSFYIEYPCHSPDEQRWFALRATPLAEFPGFAVVAHDNITERIVTERALTHQEQTEAPNFVVQLFPEWRDRIEEMLSEHQEFAEICEDYQELATWVDEHRSAYAGREELEDSLRSLDSLAEEIGRYLGVDNANER